MIYSTHQTASEGREFFDDRTTPWKNERRTGYECEIVTLGASWRCHAI